MLIWGCVRFQLGACDQDSRLLEEELADMQQTEEENQFAISQERHRCDHRFNTLSYTRVSVRRQIKSF